MPLEEDGKDFFVALLSALFDDIYQSAAAVPMAATPMTMKVVLFLLLLLMIIISFG